MLQCENIVRPGQDESKKIKSSILYIVYALASMRHKTKFVAGTDKSVHLRSLISAFDISKLEGLVSKIVSEYEQDIPQSQTADKPMAPRGRATQQSRDARKTN